MCVYVCVENMQISIFAPFNYVFVLVVIFLASAERISCIKWLLYVKKVDAYIFIQSISPENCFLQQSVVKAVTFM